jgi:hypothetical protein
VDLSRKGTFLQCVDLPKKVILYSVWTILGRALWRDWAYLAVYGIYTVYGMYLLRKGILHSVLTHLGGHFVQFVGLTTKDILYSVLPYLGGYFVQCMDLSRNGVLCSLSYLGEFCTV